MVAGEERERDARGGHHHGGPDRDAGGGEQLPVGERLARQRRKQPEGDAVQHLDQPRGVHAADDAARMPLHGGGELVGRQ